MRIRLTLDITRAPKPEPADEYVQMTDARYELAPDDDFETTEVFGFRPAKKQAR